MFFVFLRVYTCSAITMIDRHIGGRKKPFNSGLGTKCALQNFTSIHELGKRRNKKWVADGMSKDI